MRSLAAIRNRLVVLLGAFLVAACTIGVVPAYDADLAEGLSDAHAQAMVQFARVEEGSPAGEYAAHAESYAELIGAFAELHTRADTRPMPPLAARLEKSPVFRTVCPDSDPRACLNASPASLMVVLSTLRDLRKTHRTEGLTPIVVEGLQRQYLTAVRQALTVEAALER